MTTETRDRDQRRANRRRRKADRAAARGSPVNSNSSATTPERTSPRSVEFPVVNYKAGDKVEAKYKNQWFKANVTKNNGDGTFAVQFTEGDLDKKTGKHYAPKKWKGSCVRRPRVTPPTSPQRTPVTPPASPQLRYVNNTFTPGKKWKSKLSQQKTTAACPNLSALPKPAQKTTAKVMTLTEGNLQSFLSNQGQNWDAKTFQPRRKAKRKTRQSPAQPQSPTRFKFNPNAASFEPPSANERSRTPRLRRASSA